MAVPSHHFMLLIFSVNHDGEGFGTFWSPSLEGPGTIVCTTTKSIVYP